MTQFFSPKPIPLCLAFLLLTGCAQTKPEPEPPPQPTVVDSISRVDLDELLSFGADMVGKTSAERAKACQTLLSRQKEATRTGVQLHLLAGRLLSDACGDIPAILEGVEAIPTDNLPDDHVRRLVSQQTETLKRLQNLSKKLALLERKQKSAQSLLKSKPAKSINKAKSEVEVPKEVEAPKEDEAQRLRDKLEAIRAMEKKLDESGGGN
jgi:hypothetical protein